MRKWGKVRKKLGFEMKKFHNRNFLSYEIPLFFPNFVPLFHQDTNGFKQKSKHESCSPLQNLQLLFTKFPQKKLVAQVTIFGTRVPNHS